MPDTALMQFLFYMKVNVYLYNFNLYKSLRGYLQADNIRTYSFATTSVYTENIQKQSGDNDLHFANCLPDRNFPFSIFNFTFN